MTRKNPTKRRAERKLRDLEDDVGTGGDDDFEVNIRTFGVDRAETVDDVDTDHGVVLSGPEPCAVDACDEWALAGADRCPVHYDGDSDALTDE
jgi:hypothetical protein